MRAILAAVRTAHRHAPAERIRLAYGLDSHENEKRTLSRAKSRGSAAKFLCVRAIGRRCLIAFRDRIGFIPGLGHDDRAGQVPSTHATITRDVWGYVVALGVACIACGVLYAAYSEFQIDVRVTNALREHGLLQPARLARGGPARATRAVAIFESPALEEGLGRDGKPRHPPVGELAAGTNVCVSFYSVDSAPIVQISSRLTDGTIRRVYAKNEVGNFAPIPNGDACSGVWPLSKP
jgi:hypothetical protein